MTDGSFAVPVRTPPVADNDNAASAPTRVRSEGHRLRAARRARYATATAFAEAAGVGLSEYVALETGCVSPLRASSLRWRKTARVAAFTLGVSLRRLWPAEAGRVAARRAAAEAAFAAGEAVATPEELYAEREERGLLDAYAEHLAPMKRRILGLRVDGKTLAEIGEVYGLGRERIRSILLQVVHDVARQHEKVVQAAGTPRVAPATAPPTSEEPPSRLVGAPARGLTTRLGLTTITLVGLNAAHPPLRRVAVYMKPQPPDEPPCLVGVFDRECWYKTPTRPEGTPPTWLEDLRVWLAEVWTQTWPL